jgi:DNA-binding CsgD family transcriptional regulator
MAPRRGPGRPYLLAVAPLAPSGGGAVAFVAFRDPDLAAAAAAAQLRRLFGLSAAEAQLAALLGEGMTPAAIARARGASLATVRTQLRAVSDKTGCRRLAQVAALAAGLPAL